MWIPFSAAAASAARLASERFLPESSSVPSRSSAMMRISRMADHLNSSRTAFTTPSRDGHFTPPDGSTSAPPP